ncbi:DUF7620 family protein [Bacillus mobilis]
MNWCSRLRRRFDPPPMTRGEIAELKDRSEEASAQTRALDEEVHDVAARLRHQRTQNNFGPLIWAALQGETDV